MFFLVYNLIVTFESQWPNFKVFQKKAGIPTEEAQAAKERLSPSPSQIILPRYFLISAILTVKVLGPCKKLFRKW